MRRISFILLLALITVRANGQVYSDPKLLGDKAFNNKNYYEAAFYYKKAAEGLNIIKQIEVPYHSVNTKSKKVAPADGAYVSYRLAESYRLYENYLEAETFYYKVLNDNFENKYPLARLWYGVCLRANQHFDEAIKQLEQFTMAYKGEARYLDLAKKEIATCHFAKEQYQYPLLVNVLMMKDQWNSDGSDYSIVKRDKNYWFTSSRMVKDDKKHLNRIYAAREVNALKPEIVDLKHDEKNNELEYGTPSLSPDGATLYFTRWYKDGSATIHAIYKSNKVNSEWAKPEKLNSNVNVAGFNAIQPFITADGKRLFFSSNKPGGQGGDDIWVSDLDASGNPTNSVDLGTNVNSSYDEQAPYYDLANKRLVYSSKGFLGLGGFDLFESYDQMSAWTQPENLGYPMNSAKDDLYYYPDTENPKKFYISSDRSSDCCLDLFEVYDQRHMFTGLVVDCETQTPLAGAKVTFIDSLSRKELKTLILDKNGKYEFNVTTRRPYALRLEKTGYFSKVVPVPASGKMTSDTLLAPDICLQPFKVDKPIVLKNILYDFNKTTLRIGSKVELNKLITILKNNPKIKVELASHTDSIGSDAFNLKLSTDRAQVCVEYIISNGIDGNRIFPKGYGRSKPVAPNTLPNGKDDPDGRQLNRRTEFTVLKVE